MIKTASCLIIGKNEDGASPGSRLYQCLNNLLLGASAYLNILAWMLIVGRVIEEADLRQCVVSQISVINWWYTEERSPRWERVDEIDRKSVV